jgi:hypothetical protein
MKKKLKLVDTPITARSRKGQLIEQFHEEGLEFVLNSELRPVVVIPHNTLQPVVLVDSVDFKDHLIITWAEMFNGYILQGPDLSFLLCLIRAECRNGARIVTEIEAEKIEDNPIVQTILEYMNSVDKYDGPTRKLHEECRSIDKSKSASSYSQISPFLNSFGRELRRLIPALQGYGVDVEVEHTEAGSRTILRRNELFNSEPQPMVRGGKTVYADNPQTIIVPSDVSPNEGASSDSADGTEGSPEGTEDAAGGTEGPPVGSDGNDVGSTEENS